MPKICYVEKRFNRSSKILIEHANKILAEYAQRGLVVTLRQLYYQFVSRDIIPNNQKEYKRLGSVVNDARLAGLIDWDYMQDRTRNLARLASWDSPDGIIRSAARSYHRNLWEGQKNYVEVWIEKDALVGVIDRGGRRRGGSKPTNAKAERPMSFTLATMTQAGRTCRATLRTG